MVTLQKPRQKGAAHGIRQCNAQRAPHLLGGLQRGLGLLGCGKQGAGIAQKGLSGIGQAHGLAYTVKQRGAQLGFQLRNLGGHRRLRVAQLPRRAGKAVQLGNV